MFKKVGFLFLLLNLQLISTSNAGVPAQCRDFIKKILTTNSFKKDGPSYVKNPRSFKKYKYMNFGMALVTAQVIDSTPFVRFIPTDKCNLKCSYCFQFSNSPARMSPEEFNSYLKKAKENHVGMISFLGGEPMIWKHVYYGIAQATRAHVLTDMTTNGSALNKKNIDKLGKAGLDFLNISVDGTKKSEISLKTSIIEKPELMQFLKETKKKYGMQYRMNSVIHKGNFEEIKELIEFSHEYEIPISLGFVVPNSKGEEIAGSNVYFSLEDTEQLDEIISHIVAKKRAGYDIIDPEEYFEGMHQYLRKEDFWKCNYPTKFGWVNITPNGGIRSCTKKMGEMDGLSFLNLDGLKIRELKSRLKTMVGECNKNCYSNCAFDSYFFKTHKWKALKRLLGITKPLSLPKLKCSK